MVAQETAELTSSHRHNTPNTKHGTIPSEGDMETR